MHVLIPIKVDDTVLTSSNVAENDYLAWSGSTTYAVGSRVMVLSSHSIYESVSSGNVGNNPTTDDGTNWVFWNKTERWRAFDESLSGGVTNSGGISYTLTVPSTVDGLAIIGLQDATSVSVNVRNASNVSVQTLTQSGFAQGAVNRRPILFTGLLATVDYRLVITVNGTDPFLLQIVPGLIRTLGISQAGTEVGFQDNSSIERDEFGNAQLIRRSFFDTATFQFAVRKGNLQYVKTAIAGRRAVSSFWYTDPDDMLDAAAVYGFPSGTLSVPLEANGYHFASLDIEGMT